MATLLGRGIDDYLLDAYATRITAWRDAQIALATDADAVTFDIERDKADPLETDVPLVNLILDGDAYMAGRSGGRGLRSGTLTIKAQCIAPKNLSRLLYLKHQVLAALFDIVDDTLEETLAAEMGITSAKGLVSGSGWPSWSRVEIETDKNEIDLYAGEWSWEISYAWKPDEIARAALAAVHGELGAQTDKVGVDYTL